MEKEILLRVINDYSKAFNLLDSYDHQTLTKIEGNNVVYKLTYEDARQIIDSLRFKNDSEVFGVEKEKGKLNGILEQINQEVFGKELYCGVEEKAARLLYFLVKDHPFADGCKRIAASLFINYLHLNNCLYRNKTQVISNEALVAITILVAESNPDDYEIIIRLIANLLK